MNAYTMAVAPAPPPPSPTGRWLLIGEAARVLGVSRSVVRKLIRDRRLTVRKVGSWNRIPAHEVERLAEASTRPALVWD